MESVSSGKKKKFPPNLSFPYRRKRSSLSTKTLKPPLDSQSTTKSPQKTGNNVSQDWNKNSKSDLNFDEKKILFRLIRPSLGKKWKTFKGCKRHLDRLKVDDDLDLNKRIEKVVKEIALENQRKENSAKELTISDGIQDDYAELKDKPYNEKSSSFPFFNHIKKIFSFSKNYFNNNKVNSVPIDSAQGKVLVSDKAAHISSYDLLKTMRKTTRFRRSSHTNRIPYRCSGKIVYQNELIEKSCPHSTHFKGKRHFKRRKTTRRVIDGRRKRRKHRNMKKRKVKRRGKKVKNWPLFKNYLGHDLRLRRDQRTLTTNLNDISTAKTEAKNTDSEVSQKEIPFHSNEGLGNKGKDSSEESSSLVTTSELATEDSMDSGNDLNMTDDDMPQHTLGKPFLEGNDSPEKTSQSNYSPVTECPLYTPANFLSTPNYKYELPNEEYLTPDRYLQIRHALRSYLVHNNVFTPVKRTINPERNKRCGKCSRARKCWKSPPLLCIPYIRKGQEDQLKYLIKLLQSMLGKPFPPKVDIFDRTKFKPSPRKEKENSFDYEQGDDYSNFPGEENSFSKYNANMNVLPLTSPMPEASEANPPFPSRSVSSVCPSMGQTPPMMSPSMMYPPVTPPPMAYPPGSVPVCSPATCPPVTCHPASYPAVTSPPFNHPVTAYVSPSNLNSQQPYDSFTPTGSTGESGEFTNTEKVLIPGELPFSFPVLGQEADQFTKCSCDEFKTTQSVYPTAQSEKMPATGYSGPGNVPANNSYSEQTPPLMPAPSCKTNLPTNSCGVQNPDSSGEQKEYFSFAAYSYNGGANCVTETYKYSESLTSNGGFTQPPPFPLCNTNQKYYPQRAVCESFYTTRHMPPPTNALPPPRIPPTVNPMASPGTQRFQPQMLRPVKYRKPLYPEYIFGTAYVKHDQNNRKPLYNPQKMRSRKTGMGSPIYEDQFNPPTEPNPHNAQMKYEIAQNRLFRMHHRVNPKHNNNYDYDMYDKYPQENPKPNNIRFSMHPRPYGSMNDYGRKNTKVEKRDKLIRHKRGDDYYSWPEGPENYNDYLDDPNYGDEYRRGMPALNVENSDTWTPPSYDMFSELAKAVTGTKRQSNTSATVSVEIGHTIQLTENATTTTTTGSTPTNERNDHSVTYDNTVSHTSNHKVFNPSTTPLTDSGWIPDNSNDAKVSKKKKKICSTSDKTTASTKSDSRITKSSFAQGDDSKRKKTAPYSPNTKTTSPTRGGRDDNTKSNSLRSTSATTPRKGKEIDGNQNTDSGDEVQMPTTLKMASIAKGLKKSATKPSPKVYTKVYPESLGNKPETNDTTRSTKVTTPNVKTTPLGASTSGDLKLQILAVCEGYLEVIKLIKTQNQTPTEALDMDLSRYCENIISQSFNGDSQKSRRADFAESSSQPTRFNDNSLKGNSETRNDFFDGDMTDTTNDYIDDLETEETVKQKDSEIKENLDSLKGGATENETGETKKPESGKKKKKKKKKKKRRKSQLSANPQEEQQQQLETTGDEAESGVTQEQVELIKLLRKRKNALLSWLLNTRDHDKASDMQETEYFDDEDLMESDIPQDSGTVKPKRDEKTPGTTENKLSFVNESIFPVYAKQYGYDSGGEVREVEVLWRKVNEKTHEKKIYKNVSVLALLLFSTNAPKANRRETKLVGSNGYGNGDVFEIQSKNENKPAIAGVSTVKSTKSSTTVSATSTPCSCTTHKSKRTKSPGKNATRTVLTKPDASCIVGKPPKAKRTHQNKTHKICHKFGAAKDLFQEYSIEFLDYAVYILPIMFTILFLFCCLCCAVHIFHAGKSHKKKKKKKKLAISSDDTTETTEESEFESKKRKREAKRKRKCKEGTADIRRGKKFWNVLKLHPTKASSEATESSQTEKKKSFLRFLKCKKGEDKTESSCRIPLCEVEEIAKNSQDSTEGKHCLDDSDEKPRVRKNEEEKHKSEEESEAAERRELIALLEELKKIETEHTTVEDRKEVKSVQVQYMTQEDENVFRRPDFSYPYEKNVFGLPKGYSFCSKQLPFHEAEPPAARGYELYEGVNELTGLLPCECSYYSKRNDYCDFRINHEGRCKAFLNVFRDSGVSRCKPFVDKNCKKNESENRTFILNKYKSINMDEGGGFLGVTHKNAGTEVRFMENASPLTFRPRNNADLVEEMENLTHQLNIRKNVRLKDDGVLCRL